MRGRRKERVGMTKFCLKESCPLGIWGRWRGCPLREDMFCLREEKPDRFNELRRKKRKQFSPFVIPIRAENIPLNLLVEIRWSFQMDYDGYPITRDFINILEFFNPHNPIKRRVFLGVKGWGKTLNVLLALNCILEARDALPEFLPLMLRYDRVSKKFVVHNPLSFASKEEWGERLEVYDNPEELWEKCNCLIIDDIHYFLEDVIEDPKEKLEPLLVLLEKAYKKSLSKSKVLLISEEPFYTYSEILNNDEFDELSRKFGMLVRYKEKTDPYQNLDLLALQEVSYYDLEEWISILEFYGKVKIDEPSAIVLYGINKAPRGIIKISRLFKDEKTITFPKLFEKTQKILLDKNISKRKIKLYKELFESVPILNIDTLNLIFRYRSFISRFEGFEEYKIPSQEIERYSEVVASNLLEKHPFLWHSHPLYNKPLFVIRRALKQLGEQTVLSSISEIISSHEIGEKLDTTSIDNLSNAIVYFAEHNIPISKAYKGINDREILWSLGIRNRRRIYQLYQNGVLYEPFEKAFGSFLRERSSSEIMLKKLME